MLFNLAKIKKGCLKDHWARKTYNFCTCTSWSESRL